jgi:tRNA pseudouridine55 synthase
MAIDPKELQESGILLVDKPVDWTSHDVVNCVRRRFGVRKVGHCGTLDPAATGLLVLVLGRATKIAARLTNQDKAYAGTMQLGVETFSQDRDSEVIATADASQITLAMIKQVAGGFVGDIMQTPPMVSAVKKDGRPLYKLARKGEVVEREPRPVTIHELKIIDLRPPDVEFEVTCSKGTYVRTLCADIGRQLGCGAHLLNLRRTRSGSFEVNAAHAMAEIKTWEREQLLANIIPLAELLIELT